MKWIHIAAGILMLSVICGQAQETKLVKVRLGTNVNSPTRECSPIISPDGNTLYFVREGYVGPEVRQMLEKMPDSKDEKAVLEYMQKMAAAVRQNDAPRSQQSSWSSERQADGSWGMANLLPAPLNNALGSFLMGVLPDNNTLFLSLVRDPSFSGFFDGRDLVGLSQRTAKGWSDISYLRFKAFRNTSGRIHFALAPNNRVLFSAILNEDSLGALDIYVSFLQPDGTWSQPKNLGPGVNSSYRELGLFVAPDDTTVYFSSDRPGGYGGTDIYMIRRLDDSWLKWTEPKNLGPEINSSENQDHLTVDATGRYAFMIEGPAFREDIFEFALPEELRPRPVALVRGFVGDPEKNPLAAGIAYERLRDGAAAGAANSDPRTGRYQIALPLGEEYGFRAGAEGYYPVSENIDLRAAKEGQVFERDLTLIPIKVKTPIRLNNIFFDSDKSELLPASKRELERLVLLLNQYPAMTIEIRGHTDAQNTADYNLRLSEARAHAVVEYLIKAGIAAARLTWKGYGLTLPVASNETKEGRQLNRRVEFMIVKM